MMPKRADMKDQMEIQAGTSQKERYIPKSRVGKVIVNVATSPEVRVLLKRIAADQRTSSQAIILEAFNLVFEKYGEKPIA